jgi:hypothetical protein
MPQSRGSNLWWKILLAIVLLIILAGLTPLLVFRLSSAKAIHRLEANARAKGEPLTLAELAAKYRSVPEEENAAIPLLEIWEKEDPVFWQAYRSGQRKLPTPAEQPVPPAVPILGHDAARLSRTGSLSPASRKAAEDYVWEKAVHLESVRGALRRPHCVFPVMLTNITDAYAVLLPYLPEMKREAQNFRVAGALALDRGDIDASISAMEDGERTGQCLAEGQLLLDQLVRVACLSMVVNDAQRLLSQRALSAGQLDRLEGLIQRATMPGAWHSALIAERVCMSSIFEHPTDSAALLGGGSGEDSTQDSANTSGRVGLGILNVTGLSAADHRFMLEIMEQAIALADENTADSLQRYEQLFVRVSQEATRFPPKVFSAMMLPALAKAGNKFVAYEARRRAALVAIAIERYRLSHQGRVPASLEALPPAVYQQLPADPFMDQPLKFQPLPVGFVVYSVGADRQDDGGKERPEKGPVVNYDETFVVER